MDILGCGRRGPDRGRRRHSDDFCRTLSALYGIGTTTNLDLATKNRVGTAFHEVGHAVVAWSLGITVDKIALDDEDDAAGRAAIDIDQAHLPVIDRLAIWLAGIEAQTHFERPTLDRAGSLDLGNVAAIMLREGLSQQQSEETRKAGRERARGIILMHENKARQLSALLVERGQIDGAEFIGLMNAVT